MTEPSSKVEIAAEPDQSDGNTHLREVVNSILARRIVPFLGAGANLCDEREVKWEPTNPQRLPSGKELSEYISKQFTQEDNTEPSIAELTKVSQYADTVYGRGPLDDEMRPLFTPLFPPTSLHSFLASLPAQWRRITSTHTNDPVRKHLLIVTTNYDGLMERAFAVAGEPFHVVTYMANQDRHVFLHQPPNGPEREIANGTANEYSGLDQDDAPIILKVHGSTENDNFVITEDDYIDYLSFGDISLALPASLKTQLTKSSFLFLGYALHDWNLRAFLRRIWRAQHKKLYASWAVMAECSKFERLYWESHKVHVLKTDLCRYVTGLEALLATAGD